MWRYIGASVSGTSHLVRNVPCQDHHLINCIKFGSVETLWILVADGAGSARYSELGSQIICSRLDSRIMRLLSAFDGSLDCLDQATLCKWIRRIQKQLQNDIGKDNLVLRDYACTVAGIVIGKDRAICFQVGDSSIVVRKENCDYDIVFWPDNGEYANETYFVTDEDFDERLEFQIMPFIPREVALFSDGIQRLALHIETKSVHTPFFKPMFERLSFENPGNADVLKHQLEHFLMSAAVNQRTDDDKTLVMASLDTTAQSHTVSEV